MEYQEYVNLLGATHRELARELAPFNTLENVLGWMKARGLSLATLDVVAQDEYSHDVLIPFGPDGSYLVFGVT
jgi:hypothetical protein